VQNPGKNRTAPSIPSRLKKKKIVLRVFFGIRNKIKFSLYVLAFLNYNFTFVALLIQYSRINLPHVSFYACLLSATFSPLL